jgi:hypothetical protein
LIAAFFDAGYFWRDVGHVMSLTIPQLVLYLEHAGRIAKSMKSHDR